MIQAPVLAYPDPWQEIILDTDASLDDVGAVLSQIPEGEEKLIAHYSKTISPAE